MATALTRLGYRVVRQRGSHLRLECDNPTRHMITIPTHDPLKVGLLAAILNEVAAHHNLDREELRRRLFG